MDKIKNYVPANKKFCEGICDRQAIGNMLVCHGCKRILINNDERKNTNRERKLR